MRRLVMLCAVLTGFALPQGLASALPTPMSQEQLFDKDLVALVGVEFGRRLVQRRLRDQPARGRCRL